MALASGCGEQVCTKGMRCAACRAPIGAVPAIPVRRYGSVPPPPADEPAWEVESLWTPAPATVGEFGGRAVFLAAMGAAALAGWLLYVF